MDSDRSEPIEGATREVAGHTVTDLLLLDVPPVPRRLVERAAQAPVEATSDEPWPGVPPLPWPANPPEAA